MTRQYRGEACFVPASLGFCATLCVQVRKLLYAFSAHAPLKKIHGNPLPMNEECRFMVLIDGFSGGIVQQVFTSGWPLRILNEEITQAETIWVCFWGSPQHGGFPFCAPLKPTKSYKKGFPQKKAHPYAPSICMSGNPWPKIATEVGFSFGASGNAQHCQQGKTGQHVHCTGCGLGGAYGGGGTCRGLTHFLSGWPKTCQTICMSLKWPSQKRTKSRNVGHLT